MMSRWGDQHFVSTKSRKEVCVIKRYYEEKMAWHDIFVAMEEEEEKEEEEEEVPIPPCRGNYLSVTQTCPDRH